MKLTLSWLKDHLDTEASLAQLCERLTALGLEVEGVTDRAAALKAFKVAHVLEASPHPNADKLRVCRVATAEGEVQVVCGAPNARSGIKVVFAPVGAIVPATGQELKKGVIRGVESGGMLVSERELGLSEAHEGIIEVAAEVPVGTPYASVVGLDDPLIEIALTPDRGDCAGIRGIARDLAAAGLGQLKPLDTTPVPGTFESPLGVEITAPEGACPLFIGRYLRGVRNGPSPRWLQDKLSAVGLRPISALVDVTNYFTLDRNRPLHVFDADKLQGGLIVRCARPGETLKALNGKDYVLDDGMTAVADHQAALALGGIIGGEASGCSEETVNVVLECALFDPLRTAATGRKLGIDSDARYRFERGLDTGAVVDGIEQATRLILELCGGEASQLVIAGAEPAPRPPLTLRAARVASLGGVAVAEAEQHRLLTALGFTVTPTTEGTASVTIPSWRSDVHGEADLVEEVLRLVGFDAIPTVALERTAVITRPALNARQRRTGLARRTLAARGLSEAVTWSFLASGLARAFGFDNEALRLVNPISADLDVMRPSILPNLVQAASRNRDRGLPDLGLFEVGPVFRSPEPTGQLLVASGVRAGVAVGRHWATAARTVDAFDAKADALAVLEAAGAPIANLQTTADAPVWFHPGRSGSLRLGPTVLAHFGELHPLALDAADAKGPLVGFEVFLDAIPAPKRKGGTERPLLKLSPFQPLQRDFAFVVDRALEADKLVRAAKGADKALVREVQVFDVYQGPGVEAGKKSLALAVTIQPGDKTLTDPEIEALAGKIVAAVAKATGATLRA